MMGIFVKIGLLLSCMLYEGTMIAKQIEPPEYLRYVKEVSTTFDAEMKKEFGLVCIGSGGSMPHDVEEIDLHFLAYKHVSIEEARVLEVSAIEKLVRIINDHEKLRPFLRESPFPHTRAKVMIAFEDKDGNRFKDNSVTLVYQAKGKIFYRTYDAKNNKIVPLYEEPYEEALKKVQNAK